MLHGKINIHLNFEFKNETTRGNLKANKRTLKWWPFWNKVSVIFDDDDEDDDGDGVVMMMSFGMHCIFVKKNSYANGFLMLVCVCVFFR